MIVRSRKGLGGYAYLILAWVLLMLTSGSSAATNRFVRQGASGSGNGGDWTNAYANIPAVPARDTVYWIADGTYAFPYPLNTPASGSQTIEFRKCSVSDGVSSGAAGYQATYCDGQASFNDVKLETSYWVFNGAYRNESDWAQGASYGFRIRGFETRSDFSGADRVADNVAIRYADIGPDDGTANLESYGGAVIYVGGFDRVAENWTIQRNYIHNGRAMGQMAGAHNFLWEYNWLAKNWEKTCVRHQVRGSSMVYRYNVFKNTCQGNSFDATATACTSILGWYGNAGSNNEDYSNSKVYGNVFLDTIGTVFYSDGSIWMGDDRTSQGGGPQNCANCAIFNNTFAGLGKYNMDSKLTLSFTGTKTGSEARNNIWFDYGAAMTGCQAETCSNNYTIANGGVFANAAGENFRLSSDGGAGAGFGLSTPYNTDMDGRARGAGVWDVGAYEYAGDGAPPAPPRGVRLQ